MTPEPQDTTEGAAAPDTAAAVEAIRRRREAITPGPWERYQSTDGRADRWIKADWQTIAKMLYTTPQADVDADFIAHAPTDIDTLLAALASAERDRERYREALESVGLDGKSGWLPRAAEAVNAVLVMAENKTPMLALIADMAIWKYQTLAALSDQPKDSEASGE